jgi:hypothetical protein
VLVAVIFGALRAGAATPGVGTQDRPLLISNAEELADVAELVNQGDNALAEKLHVVTDFRCEGKLEATSESDCLNGTFPYSSGYPNDKPVGSWVANTSPVMTGFCGGILEPPQKPTATSKEQCDDENFPTASTGQGVWKSYANDKAVYIKLTADIDLSEWNENVASGDYRHGWADGWCKPGYSGLGTGGTEQENCAKGYDNNLGTGDDGVWTADPGGKGWTPIGYGGYFLAHFDGDGHVIKNLYINRSGIGYLGLFGLAGNLWDEDTTTYIKNVGIESGSINSNSANDSFAGGITGKNEGILENVFNYANISVSGVPVSGTATYSAGGIAGRSEGSILKAYNYGTISAQVGDTVQTNSTAYSGGIAGIGFPGYAWRDFDNTNLYNGGDIFSATESANNKAYSGGIFGLFDINSRNNNPLTNSYSIGAVSANTFDYGNSFSGGIVGSSSGKISNSVSLAKSITSNGANIGRIAGEITAAATLTNNYAYESEGVEGDYCTLPRLHQSKWINASDKSGKNGFTVTGTDVSTPDFWTSTGIYASGGQTFGPEFSAAPAIVPTGLPSYIVNAGGATPWTRDGSAAGKDFEIGTADELACLAKITNTSTVTNVTNAGYNPSSSNDAQHLKFFKLTDDIDLKAWATADSLAAGITSTDGVGDLKHGNGKGWTAIGNDMAGFTGVFDGDGHIIENLYINSTDQTDHQTGLFGYVDYMPSPGSIDTIAIKNLGIESGSVKLVRGNGLVGAIAGVSSATMSNLFNKASVSVSGVASVPLDQQLTAGGIVGQLDFPGSISGSYNSGIVFSTATSVDNCWETDCPGVFAGGIAGSGKYALISNSYNTGAISLQSNVDSEYFTASVGGIVGGPCLEGCGISVEKSWSSGKVNLQAANATKGYAGGIAGSSTPVSDSVSLAQSITSNAKSGRISAGPSTFTNNYAWGNTAASDTPYDCATHTLSDQGLAPGVFGSSSDKKTDGKDGLGVSAFILSQSDFWTQWASDLDSQVTGDQKGPSFTAMPSTLVSNFPSYLQEQIAPNGTDHMWGDADNPIEIGTPDQLACLATITNSGTTNSMQVGKHFMLTDDLDLKAWATTDNTGGFPVGDATHGNGAGWTPIGLNTGIGFGGYFDGGGHKIENLYIKSTAEKIGLFGAVDGNPGTSWDTDTLPILTPELKNFGIESGSIISLAPTTNYNAYTGAIVGYAKCAIISGVYNKASVVAITTAGGIAGNMDLDSAISRSYNTGSVTSSNAGGIVGRLYSASVDNSYNTGTVTSDTLTGGSVGGIVSNNYSNSKKNNPGYPGQWPSITKTYNTGDVKGTSTSYQPKVGGIIAYQNNPISFNVQLGSILHSNQLRLFAKLSG